MDDATLERISQLLGHALVGVRERRLGAEGSTRRGPQVWLLELEDRRVVVKLHRERRGFDQERDALATWVDARIPRLLASDSRRRLLVLEHLPGVCVDELDDDEARRAAWQQAGEFLADLHARPLADLDPLALAQALPQRLRAWRRACESLLDGPTRSLVDRLEAEAPELLAGVGRVACHRDFAPRNWLWASEGGRGRLHVVDFEHSRPDLAALDLAKLATRWDPRSDLATAFWRGYGRREDELRELLRLALGLHGLASSAWGQRHDEPEFVAEGRQALARALAMG